ncbi:MAG: hypothetical protein EOP61_28470 [Sphingomonadales bacterium]|nr:MAG: hypothetical protein EOP61_28470 [Sphingomonadales bacterium]
MARGEFVDENLPWPLWRPVLGTIVGCIALMAVSIAAPVVTRDTASLVGAACGRAALAFTILYFPAYSRRGWAWRICAFALFVGAAFVGNDMANFAANYPSQATATP